MSEEIIWLGLVASLVAGLATGIEAIPILFIKTISDKLSDIILRFSVGVMRAATSAQLQYFSNS